MKWVWLVLVVLYAAFLGWHEWRGPPMDRAEVATRLADLAAHRKPGQAGDHDLVADLRRLAERDDGEQYFMVNLIRFRDRAVYPPGFADAVADAREADAKYNAIVVPELLARGSYPVFVSEVVGTFIDYPGAERWDVVAIVRYRSRRDMLDMVRALQDLGGGEHKWAAIERTQVFPVHARIRVAPLPPIVAVVFLAIGLTLQLLTRRRGAARSELVLR